MRGEKDFCWNCANRGPEESEERGSVWGSCRVNPPELRLTVLVNDQGVQLATVPPRRGEFPFMPRDGWCAHHEPADRTAASVEFGPLKLRPKP